MFSWLKMLRSESSRRPGGHRPSRAWPQLEPLEDRLALYAVQNWGGPILPHVQVQAVYYGNYWVANNNIGWNQAQGMDGFFQSITNGAYMDQMNEYTGPAGVVGVGRGSFYPDDFVPAAFAPGTVVTDASLRGVIRGEINAGWLQPVNRNTLYFIFTPPNVVVSHDGVLNTDPVNGYCGYHWSGPNGFYYAVIPYQQPATFGGVYTNTFDGMTWTAAHELAEACTDPDVNNGAWYNGKTGNEIGDIGDIIYPGGVVYKGYRVSALWSQQAGAAVYPPGATVPSATIYTASGSSSGGARAAAATSPIVPVLSVTTAPVATSAPSPGLPTPTAPSLSASPRSADDIVPGAGAPGYWMRRHDGEARDDFGPPGEAAGADRVRR
jgi:hypothetical protein